MKITKEWWEGKAEFPVSKEEFDAGDTPKNVLTLNPMGIEATYFMKLLDELIVDQSRRNNVEKNMDYSLLFLSDAIRQDVATVFNALKNPALRNNVQPSNDSSMRLSIKDFNKKTDESIQRIAEMPPIEISKKPETGNGTDAVA